MFLLKSFFFDHLAEIVIGIAAVAFLWFVYSAGENHIQGKWDKANDIEQIRLNELTAKLTAAQNKVVIKYVTEIKEVQVKGKETIKYVTKIVNQKADDNCVINDGAIRLLDTAAKAGTFEDRPLTDATPSGVALSTQVRSVVQNYNTCNQYRIQINSLIDVLEVLEKQ